MSLGSGEEMVGGSYEPVAVAIDPLARIVVGGDHACGASAQGAIYCWGTNANGALALPDTLINAWAPVPLYEP